ncbi:MAG TPA: ABC transporter permease [Actinomycetota bacterium]|nr:ABC transporter permease [Actinomycetota bacterium]
MSVTEAPAPEALPEVHIVPPTPRLVKVLVGMGVFALVVFGWLTPAGEQVTFQLTLGGEALAIPDVTLPAKLSAIVFSAIALLAALGAWAASRKEKSLYVYTITFGIFFVLGFLSWAVAGATINLVGLLQGSLLLAVPLVFGAMSGVLCERAGVINLGIEGQLLTGAFMAAVVASLTQNAYLGLLAAPLGGLFIAFLLAVFAIKYWVDQVILGVVLNVLAVGLTSFFYSRLLAPNQTTWNSPPTFSPIAIPVLSDIPIIGPILFNQNIVVYLMYVIVIVVNIALFRTKWGLRVRAVGEHPTAADTVGIRVNSVRFRNVLLGGLVAGLGGAFFTVASVGAFGKEMTAGKGFIALAAVIFGRWKPLGALGAALFFGFADNLQSVLSIIGTPIPSEFMLMTPYLATLLAVAGLVGKVRAPAADGVPYKKS